MTTNINPKRAELVAGFRALADVLESTPDLPAPNAPGLWLFLDSVGAREQLAAIESADLGARHVQIKDSPHGFQLTTKLAGLQFVVAANPGVVCTPTGTATVTTYEYVPPQAPASEATPDGSPVAAPPVAAPGEPESVDA